MAFPPTVKSEALIAGGRCCCICQEFCGTKMECNHIVPEAQGGPDTLDNCIPVCFDCHADVDRQTFHRLRELLPSDPTIVFLRTNNFAGFSFKLVLLDPVYDFEHWAALPENEFLDADLEALRSHLYHAAKAFTSELVGNTFSVGDGSRASVPEDWEETNPKRFDEAVKKIHSCAAAVCGAYDELIRLGRRKLEAR
jgi:hypothetical protein